MDSTSPKQSAQARAGPGESAQAKAAVQATPEPAVFQNLETRSNFILPPPFDSACQLKYTKPNNTGQSPTTKYQ